MIHIPYDHSNSWMYAVQIWGCSFWPSRARQRALEGLGLEGGEGADRAQASTAQGASAAGEQRGVSAAHHIAALGQSMALWRALHLGHRGARVGLSGGAAATAYAVGEGEPPCVTSSGGGEPPCVTSSGGGVYGRVHPCVAYVGRAVEADLVRPARPPGTQTQHTTPVVLHEPVP